MRNEKDLPSSLHTLKSAGDYKYEAEGEKRKIMKESFPYKPIYERKR